MRVERRFRATIYAVVALLFITGAAWLAVDQGTDAFAPDAGWGQVSAALLAAHGGFAEEGDPSLPYENWIETRYEAKARRAGRSSAYLRFRRRG